MWLDSRAEEDEVTRALVAEIGATAAAHAAAQGCTAELTEQSWSGTVHFPDGPRMAISRGTGRRSRPADRRRPRCRRARGSRAYRHALRSQPHGHIACA